MTNIYPLYSPLPNPIITGAYTVPKGTRFIQFFNNGSADIIINSYDKDDVLKGKHLCKAGSTYDFPERVEGGLWGKFDFDATGTEVWISANIALPENN